MDELISVVVPVYNVEQYIARCIDSILKQTYTNFEIILIDDGSPDQSGRICDEYAAIDKRITVIHQKNKGLSAARNAGLDIMRGQYVTFIDSDDFIHERYLAVLYQLIKRYGVGVSQVAFERGVEDVFSKTNRKIEETLFNDSILFGDRNVKITACAKLYTASVFINLRFPEGRINEDEFVTYKAIAYGEGIIVSSEKLYYYYSRPTSIMHTKKTIVCLDFQDAYRERIQFFKQRNDLVATDMSYKEYAIRLMLVISSCMSDPNNKNNMRQMLEDFQDAYSSICNKNIINKKERMILWLFSKWPTVVAKVIHIIR